MKTRLAFPLMLGAAILAGGYGGHLMRRSAVPLPGDIHLPRVSSEVGNPLVPKPSQGPLTEVPAQMRRWLDTAAELAENPLADPAMDAPHLLLTLASWNARDFATAMEQAGRLPESPARRRIEEWILTQWMERSPVAAMAWTCEHRPDRYPAAVEALARRDAAAAWQAVQENPVPGNNSGDTASSIFLQWAAQDRLAALDAWLKMDRKVDDSFRAGLGYSENALPPKAKDPAVWSAARNALTEAMSNGIQNKVSTAWGGGDLPPSACDVLPRSA